MHIDDVEKECDNPMEEAQENQQTFDWIGLGWHQLFEEGYRERLQAK